MSKEKMTDEDIKNINLFQRMFYAREEMRMPNKDGKNPFYNNSKYHTYKDVVNALDPVLTKFRLLLMHAHKGGEVSTFIVNIDNPEEMVESTILIPPNINDPQKICAAVTYFNRYGITGLFSIIEPDDDGNGSIEDNKKPEIKTKKKYLPLDIPKFLKELPQDLSKYKGKWIFAFKDKDLGQLTDKELTGLLALITPMVPKVISGDITGNEAKDVVAAKKFLTEKGLWK